MGRNKFKFLCLLVAITIPFIFVEKIIKVNAYEPCFVIEVENREYKFFYPEFSFNLSGLNLKDKDAVADMIYQDTLINFVDAKIIFQPEKANPFEIIKERDGYGIDKIQLLNEINCALSLGNTRINVKKHPIKANITKEMLKRQTFLRGSFSTYYGNSSENRKHNIKLASSFINGTIIEKGEEFSFNKIVGERSKERGFLPAKIIVDGSFVEGCGGGVCQVSTTVYNGALKSGLEILESHPHSLSVSYVQPSFDAMVSYGLWDLRFLNTSESDIYISMKADGENLKIDIFGLKNDKNYRLVSKIKKVIEPEIKIIKRGSIGGEMQEKHGKKGILSEGYLYIYQNNVLLDVKRIREDRYKKVDEIRYED